MELTSDLSGLLDQAVPTASTTDLDAVLDATREDDVLFYLHRGADLLQKRRPEEARAALERAHQLSPDNPKVENLLGLVYFKLGLLEAARSVYDQMVERFPKEPPLYVNLGLVLLRQGRLLEAERALMRAIALSPDHTRAHCYLGLVLYRRGELEKARDHFLRARAEDFARKVEEKIARADDPSSPAEQLRAVAEGGFRDLQGTDMPFKGFAHPGDEPLLRDEEAWQAHVAHQSPAREAPGRSSSSPDVRRTAPPRAPSAIPGSSNPVIAVPAPDAPSSVLAAGTVPVGVAAVLSGTIAGAADPGAVGPVAGIQAPVGVVTAPPVYGARGVAPAASAPGGFGEPVARSPGECGVAGVSHAGTLPGFGGTAVTAAVPVYGSAVGAPGAAPGASFGVDPQAAQGVQSMAGVPPGAVPGAGPGGVTPGSGVPMTAASGGTAGPEPGPGGGRRLEGTAAPAGGTARSPLGISYTAWLASTTAPAGEIRALPPLGLGWAEEAGPPTQSLPRIGAAPEGGADAIIRELLTPSGHAPPADFPGALPLPLPDGPVDPTVFELPEAILFGGTAPSTSDINIVREEDLARTTADLSSELSHEIVSAPGFHAGPGARARLVMEDRAYLRSSAIVAASGPMSMSPVVAQLQGRPTGTLFGGAADPMCALEGSAILLLRVSRFAVALRGVRDLHVVEGALVGFDRGFTWDNGRVLGMEVVTLRGSGSLLLDTRGDPMLIPVDADTPVHAAREGILAWSDGVRPSPVDSANSEGRLFRLRGRGYVLVAFPPEGGPNQARGSMR